MKNIFESFLIIFLIDNIFSVCVNKFPWTLPSDASWPPSYKFLELRSNISGNVILKGDLNYNPHTWNRITNVPKPAAIIQPLNSDDILAALKFAKAYNIRLSVQSTGHHQDHRNIYDNSIHIDMSTMDSKSIDLEKKTLTVGPGNTFREIQTFVAIQTNKKLVALGGADPSVGIYGWTVGGGHGALTKMYGLGVDALLSVQIITADLNVITASETENQDLFRSLRGSGGGAFGITTSLTVKLFPDPGTVSVFTGYFPLSAETSSMFANFLIEAPNFVSGYFLMQNFGSFYNTYIQIQMLCFSNSTTCFNILSSLQEFCIPLPGLDCTPALDAFPHYFDFIIQAEMNTDGVTYLASTSLNSSNIVDGLSEITNYIADNIYTGCVSSAVLGGVSATLDADRIQTCVSPQMRNALIAVTCYCLLIDSTSHDDRLYQISLMDTLSEKVYKKYNDWVYWNEPLHNFAQDDWKSRYWGGLDNYNKLLSVKNKYDPENFFTCYHCIGYVKYNSEDPAVCPINNCTCSNTPYGVCNAY